MRNIRSKQKKELKARKRRKDYEWRRNIHKYNLSRDMTAEEKERIMPFPKKKNGKKHKSKKERT